MQKKLRKAFTLVELVIVIAVVAILAAVLIPTFGGVINKSNLSVDTQTATNINKNIAFATRPDVRMIVSNSTSFFRKDLPWANIGKINN